MYSPSRDPVAAVRMLEVLDQASAALGVVPDGGITWGRFRRTVSRRVRYQRGPAWLRLSAAPLALARGRFWEGNEAAEKAFGDLAGVRPSLLNLYDWADDGTAYRVELMAYVDEPMCSGTPEPSPGPDLGDRWWATLRRALEAVGRVATDRVAVRQEWIDAAVPRFVSVPPPRVAVAAPSHGDLHWANLTAYGPHIVGWQGWGLAPVGYDAAKLHLYSLADPALAARVRAEFPVLDTQSGRIAETVALAELLHGVSRGRHVDLADTLRARARELHPLE